MSDSSENKNVVKNIFLVALSNIISLLMMPGDIKMIFRGVLFWKN